MEFVRVGDRIFNLNQIVYLEVTNNIILRVHFCGAEPLDLQNDEADALVNAINAKDVLEPLRKSGKAFEDLKCMLGEKPSVPPDDPGTR